MSINFFRTTGVLAFSLFIGQCAQAGQLPPAVRGVVVTAPGVNSAEAKAFATTQDKLLLSDFLESSRPGEDYDRQLTQRLEKAQRAWLSGESENARAEFRALTELSLKADWRNAQREVLQTAYLRLAQSSDSGTERESWLDSAARLFMDLSPNPGLFPPPLLAEYEASKKRIEATAVDIDLRDVFPDFRYLIVDGRKRELATESRLRLSKGLHRLTAYSDSHEPVTEFLTAAQLRVLRLSPPVLTEGSCTGARLRSRAELPSSLEIEIYSGPGCSSTIGSVLQASRLVSEPSLANNFAKMSANSNESPRAGSNSKTWLWVVGGAVIAAAGYAVASHASSPEPIHTNGF